MCRLRSLAQVGGLAAGLLLVGQCLAAEPAKTDSRSPTLGSWMPRWELGDRWVVETTSRPIQVRGEVARTAVRPIQWQFSVERFEKSLENDCCRVEIRCLADPSGHPLTVVWIDRKSLAIRQLAMEIPVPDGFQTITQSYEFPNDQVSPVLVPLTAVPLDLPVFYAEGGKGTQTFSYETHGGPAGAKAIGDVGFACEVEQQTSLLSLEEVKDMVHGTFAKTLEAQPVLEFRLKGPGRSVRQLWQPSLPWPVYSENGATTCRLVKVIPTAGRAKKPQEPQP